MTRPILGRYVTWVSVLALCAALIFTTLRLRSSEAAVQAQHDALNAQRDAIDRNRQALQELCRTNGIIRGLVSEAIDFREAILQAGDLPPTLRARYRMSNGIYEGYLAQLDQETACREVVRP